ncbi:MAG: hypothetical protein B7Z37_26245 [Verrucomicrobia bacterium 12-59-8]|nr:MAG: hypothetical protein B7Z37_26245 [Verrucomicrobia bacterium 12-59-8]
MTRLATTGLLLAMLLMLSSCTSWRNAAAFKKLNTRTLEDEYMRVIELENRVDAKTVQSVIKPGARGKTGPVELRGVPFWTAPQYEWIRSINTAVMSPRARRHLKLKCIKKYGVGFVVFKPDPADRNFLQIGESDDKGFTMAELHQAFGSKLPPFSSLLKLCLRQN